MITLLRGGEVFSPEPLGIKDILVLHEKIGAVTEPDQIKIQGIPVEERDASGKMVFPGFIDSHAHILGGGGEGGPRTRAPEISVEGIVSSGVATVIGCLGTDGTTRHMNSLLTKAQGLEEEGVSTYIFIGSYEVPVVTITGSIRSDLILIEKAIGAGEIAISDHRSSQPTFDEFARLASECRVGGMLGGKAGILHCHLGDGTRRLEFFFRLVRETEIPPTQIIPTHVNRNLALFEEGLEFVKMGGYIDLTACANFEDQDEEEISVPSAIRFFLERKLSLSQITVSSDSNGSLPRFDKKGNLAGLTVATQKSLLANFRYLIQHGIVPPEQAIRPFATNPAEFYKLPKKGEIRAGNDADLLLFDRDFNLKDSFHMGRLTMANGKLAIKGTFS